MSAPDTNLERQKKRHGFPIKGIALVLGFVAILFLAYLMVVAERGDSPAEEGAAATATE